MYLTARPLLWGGIIAPILTFACTYPIAYTQSWVGTVDGHICERPLKYPVDFLSDTLDYSPAGNVGVFGLVITLIFAVFIGLMRFEFIRNVLHCWTVTINDSNGASNNQLDSVASASTSTSSTASSLRHRSVHVTPLQVVQQYGLDETKHEVIAALIKQASTAKQPVVLIRRMHLLNRITLFIGLISLIGALGVVSVPFHHSNDLHNISAGIFFGGLFIYQCLNTHLSRKLDMDELRRFQQQLNASATNGDNNNKQPRLSDESIISPSSSSVMSSFSNWRIQIAIDTIVCITLIGGFAVLLGLPNSNEVDASGTPIDPAEGYSAYKDRVIIQVSAGLEIFDLLLMLAYFATWDSEFKSMRVRFQLAPSEAFEKQQQQQQQNSNSSNNHSNNTSTLSNGDTNSLLAPMLLKADVSPYNANRENGVSLFPQTQNPITLTRLYDSSPNDVAQIVPTVTFHGQDDAANDV